MSIVEEFIDGTLFHSDSIYHKNKAIFECVCEYSVPNHQFTSGKCLISLVLPFNSNNSNSGFELSNKVANIIDYKDGPMHLEFFISKTGEVIFLEVAGRTPGAFIVPMYKKQFGINLLNIDLISQFKDCMPLVKKEEPYYLSAIFPYKEGVVTKFNKPINIKSEDYNIIYNVAIGDYLESPTSLWDISATMLLKSINFDESRQRFDEIKDISVIECLNS